MKTIPPMLLIALVPGAVFSQLIDSASFFHPDPMTVRRPGATSGIITAAVNNTLYTDGQSSGNVSWTYGAAGLIQTRATVTVIVPIADLDVQLAALVRNEGDALVFGREITASATLAGIPVTGQGDNLNNLISNLVSASVLYGWSADASISGLDIQAGHVYQVSFDVTAAAGLPAGVLSAANFGITTAGVTDTSNQSVEVLNVLDLITIGGGESTGRFTLEFQSDQNLDELNFRFAAASTVGANLLGGSAGQDYLTFSNFEVSPIPEPSTVALSGVLAGMLMLRRRRHESV